MSPDVIVDIGDFTAPPSGSPTATANDVLQEAWAYLYTGVRVERDKLATAMNSSVTTLVDTYLRGGIKAGAKLSVDLEDMHVWANTGDTSTVQRGEFGSTAAAHAAGSIIHVNAEFTPFEVFKQMNNELKSLSSPGAGLFVPRVVTLTYAAATYGYDLTGVDNIDGIVDVMVQGASADAWMSVTDWHVDHNLDTDVFASGHALFLGSGYPGRDVRVVYRGQFSELADLDDDVETTTGLPYSAFDVLAMGAALRCAYPAEIDRNQMGSQGSGRRSSEVPAGARLNAVRGLAQQHRDRIKEERARLLRRYPTRLIRRY